MNDSQTITLEARMAAQSKVLAMIVAELETTDLQSASGACSSKEKPFRVAKKFPASSRARPSASRRRSPRRSAGSAQRLECALA
jgi:hypothetical protein